MSAPFRWNLARREQLGRLVDGAPAAAYDEFVDDVRSCAGRVLALSRDCDLAFVGRSPESVFDYLSGALQHTSWAERLSLVNVSLRGLDLEDIKRNHPGRLHSLYEHLSVLDLNPLQIARRRPVAFVDLVATGSTFRALVDVLRAWSHEAEVDPNTLIRKVRFVGITWRTKTSPNTIRWQQRAPWLSEFPADAVKNVSIPGRLWDYLGNIQPKVALSNPPWRWGEADTQDPPHYDKNLEALRLALRTYDIGAMRDEKARLASDLAAMPEMRNGWLRSLVSEMRGTSIREHA